MLYYKEKNSQDQNTLAYFQQRKRFHNIDTRLLHTVLNYGWLKTNLQMLDETE